METGTGIRKSPYEPGLWFVSAEPGTTLQDHGTQWQVGPNWGGAQGPLLPLPASLPCRAMACDQVQGACERVGAGWQGPAATRCRHPTPAALPPTAPLQVGERYRLIKVLGYGSYSGVCLAVDETTGEKVGRARVRGWRGERNLCAGASSSAGAGPAASLATCHNAQPPSLPAATGGPEAGGRCAAVPRAHQAGAAGDLHPAPPAPPQPHRHSGRLCQALGHRPGAPCDACSAHTVAQQLMQVMLQLLGGNLSG